eukprot:9486277-Pyramimonas_sp.AAC.1
MNVQMRSPMQVMLPNTKVDTPSSLVTCGKDRDGEVLAPVVELALELLDWRDLQEGARVLVEESALGERHNLAGIGVVADDV